MPTQITQIDDAGGGPTVLRVEGEMTREDALLLVRIASEIIESSGTAVTIDLADLDLMDGEAASVLKQIGIQPNIRIEGIEIFLQTAVDTAERN